MDRRTIIMAYEVSIIKCDSYDADKIRTSVEASLAPLGGLESVVKNGDRVLIKLNLSVARPPEAAVTTHPAVAKTVIQMVQERGATPIVGDSPGGGISVASYKALLKKTGIQRVIDETGCESVRFDDGNVEVFSERARTFKKLTLAKAVTEADVIIALPKLKTHNLTYYTGAVKLLYGYVPGVSKVEYHLYTARDVTLFAELLLDLHEMYPPAITVMDAIVGMEGAGPTNGTPRQIGLLMASKSCTALDYVAVTLAGYHPMNVPTVKVAHERGIGPDSLKDITVFGEKVASLIMEDFKKTTTTWLLGGPSFLTTFLRRFIAAKPRIDVSRCKKCGECAKDCPPKAVQFIKGSVPAVDYRKCIRCFCCEELCPEGAIDVSLPLVRKMLKDNMNLGYFETFFSKMQSKKN
jgi:uncharacterized protein (DUF362 family)/Pyruvate/2-oxoacid:ferredoxin oxidoreductase delta subunit